MPATEYAPVGRCIYCGATRYDKDTADLADEHIVPSGLGGSTLLRAASCKRCERITGQWEQRWLRGNLDPIRQEWKLQNARRQRRREKDQRTTIPLFHPTTATRTHIPAEEYPATLILPHLGAPRLFNPMPPEEDPRIWIRNQQHKIDAIGQKYGVREYATVSVDLWAVMRVLAKIAHAYTVAELGLDGFTPILPNYIIGDNDGARHFYVGSDLTLAPDVPGELISIVNEEPTVEQWDFIVIRIRLFGNLGGPTYRVVSGYRLKPTKPLELQLAEANALRSPLGMPAHYRAGLPIPPGLWDPRAPCLRGVLSRKPARHYRVKIDWRPAR